MLAVHLLVQKALEGLPVAYFAPIYRSLLEVWREMARLLKPIATKINASEKRIELVNGAVIEFWSLEDPESSRGRKYARVVIDEAAKARGLELGWKSTIRATLADYEGDAWFLSTPRGKDFFASLYARGDKSALKEGQPDPHPDWASYTASTAKNPHILPSEIEAMRSDLGPRLFSQEVEALILADREGALWTQALIDKWRHTGPLPEMKRVCIGVDPATTSGEGSNRTGIVVAGLGHDNHAYVLKNLSLRGTPAEWAQVVCKAYDDFKADKVIGETNQGGAMIEHTLRSVNPAISYKGVVAKRSKTLRAEPISALFDKGCIHHTDDDSLWDLESEMCQWVQGEESPDALDAAVHVLTELLPLRSNGARNQSVVPVSPASPLASF